MVHAQWQHAKTHPSHISTSRDNLPEKVNSLLKNFLGKVY